MVLTIHVVRQGGHHYYVRDLVPGRAEGGLVAGEEPGEWSGSGATLLGLSGPVDPRPFAEVLGGRDPRSGRALRLPRADRSSLAYDLTFCAPKSVSLLHLLAPGEIAAAAGAGHQVAVADATRLPGPPRHGGPAGPAGCRGLPRDHRSGGRPVPPSDQPRPRPAPPYPCGAGQRGPGGGWAMVQRGQSPTPRPPGRDSVRLPRPAPVRARGSDGGVLAPSTVGDGRRDRGGGRTAPALLAALGLHGRVPPSAHQPDRATTRQAFYADRPDKDRQVTVDALVDQWRRRAADLGFDLGDLTRAVGVHRHDPEPVIDRGRLLDQLGRLTGSHRSVGRHHLVAAVAASTPGGAGSRSVESVAARLLDECGPSTRESGGGGALAARWDPADLVRSVDLHRFDPPPGASDIGRRGGRAIDRSRAADIDRAGARPRRMDGPELTHRSSGVER